MLSKKKRIDISINVKPDLGLNKKNPQIPKQPKNKHNDNANILLDFIFWFLISQSKQISDSVLRVFLQK
ncbi:hypothetical protein LRB78_02815 [Borreliella americana]|uniref:hypothetical protein n=1 Tax=Borreliella americana TaxID=478807 RepID=UPI001E54ECF5|nr:hypothetical protein [Borreliella americana]MCD2349599.1 hypothetical protein [Borreliella americana]